MSHPEMTALAQSVNSCGVRHLERRRAAQPRPQQKAFSGRVNHSFKAPFGSEVYSQSHPLTTRKSHRGSARGARATPGAGGGSLPFPMPPKPGAPTLRPRAGWRSRVALARPGSPGAGLGEPHGGVVTGRGRGSPGTRNPPQTQGGSQDPPSTQSSKRSAGDDNYFIKVGGVVWGRAR